MSDYDKFLNNINDIMNSNKSIKELSILYDINYKSLERLITIEKSFNKIYNKKM